MRGLSVWRRVAALLFTSAAALPAQAAPFVYITNQDDNTVSVIDTAGNTVVATVPVGNRPYAAVATLDNTRAYIANFSDNSVSVIDARTHAVTATLTNVCTNPTWIAAMPGGAEIWVACLNSGEAKRIDIATNTVTGRVGGLLRPSSIAFNSSGSRAYIACNTGSTVRIIDTASGTQLSSLSTGFNTVDVVASPDGAHVYSTANGDKRIWDSILSPSDYTWYDLPSAPVNLVMSPDGVYIYTTVNAGAVWRIRAGQWSGMLSVGAGRGSSGIDITGDGARLYVTNATANTVSVIDTATFTNIATIPAGRRPSTNGRFVAKGPPPALAPPDPPTGVVATPGIGQVSVAFTAPANTGGGVILSYTASCGAQRATGAVSPLLVGGLANGVPVTCTVVATNSAGDSAPSAPSASVTPTAVLPGAPTSVAAALAGSGQVSVSFAPPAYDGGAAVIEYKATCGNVIGTGAASPVLVSGLVNGAAVSCTVAAINEIGAGPASAPSNSLTPGVAPDAPAAVIAVSGDRRLDVSFTPGYDGGFAVSSYRAVCGMRSAEGAQPPLTVTGLTNGVAVSCTVTATNARGTSAPSTPSEPVAPATLPDAPMIGTATRGNAQVSVAFTPGASDGGAVVSSYRATCGTQSVQGPASPLTVAGLANGVAVSCRVSAVNAVGESALSAVSNTVTPASVPSAPRSPALTAVLLNLSVDFQPPLDNGGAPISGYRASCGGREASGSAPPLRIENLPAGVTVSCSVVATNEVGDSSPSASNSVTPRTVPGAPTGVTATRGDGEVSVAFSAPEDDGASPLTGYVAVCGTQSRKGTAAPITVGGLANGVPVSCFVIALNAVGSGTPSAPSDSVTPAGVPGAPALTAAAGGDATVTLSFAAPASDNGAAISSYVADCSPGTHTVAGAQSPLQLTDLSNGIEYRCSMRALNAVGSSAVSNVLNVTPRALADLSISNSNDVDFLPGGASVSYLIDVVNHAGIAVTGARVRDLIVAPLTQASWICSGQGGGSCPASGSGDINVLVDLPAGASVTFLLSAQVAATPEISVSNTASVTAPNTVADPDSSNDSATDGPDSVGIFRSRFE